MRRELVNSRKLGITLRIDTDANAASLIFSPAEGGRGLQTYPVEDADGNVLTTVTFAPDGRLVELELLDASRQLACLQSQLPCERRQPIPASVDWNGRGLRPDRGVSGCRVGVSPACTSTRSCTSAYCAIRPRSSHGRCWAANAQPTMPSMTVWSVSDSGVCPSGCRVSRFTRPKSRHSRPRPMTPVASTAAGQSEPSPSLMASPVCGDIQNAFTVREKRGSWAVAAIPSAPRAKRVDLEEVGPAPTARDRRRHGMGVVNLVAGGVQGAEP